MKFGKLNEGKRYRKQINCLSKQYRIIGIENLFIYIEILSSELHDACISIYSEYCEKVHYYRFISSEYMFRH
jgi:hypothetical protein